jgi:C-terminal processing protease CtpA/Prc
MGRAWSTTTKGVWNNAVASLRDPPLDEVPLSDVSPGVIGVLLDGDRVVHVEPASPAEGLLLVGDRLTAVNDVPVEPGDLTEALWGLPGESVTPTIDRGGRVDTFALERADRGTAP